MDFAPYQSQSPDTSRALSPPPPTSPRRSRSFSPPHAKQPSTSTSGLPNPRSPPLRPADPWGRSSYTNINEGDAIESGGGEAGGGDRGGGGGGQAWGPRAHIGDFETSLGLRLDVEAVLAYVLLPPAGGVLLLLGEVRSDYVIHLILSWSPVLSWLLFVIDVGLIVFLAGRAYRDAETLERYEVPFFGRLASSILDDE
ncbi:MAG: hypothetical protein M1833_004903 [Piccolia ochrophora]|nr:MAG: hypothetical protein M1833_004903 [Piccolia ochrophora]